MSWTLDILIKDKEVPLSVKLKEGVTKLGREDCDIVLNDTKVSRHHCTFYLSQEDLSVIDQDSTNGTFVNGLRVKKKDIAHLDNIIVGSTQIVAKRET